MFFKFGQIKTATCNWPWRQCWTSDQPQKHTSDKGPTDKNFHKFRWNMFSGFREEDENVKFTNNNGRNRPGELKFEQHSKLTLVLANGSLCSWSRNLSKLMKVSKNMWVILQFLRSANVIFSESLGLTRSNICNDREKR